LFRTDKTIGVRLLHVKYSSWRPNRSPYRYYLLSPRLHFLPSKDGNHQHIV